MWTLFVNFETKNCERQSHRTHAIAVNLKQTVNFVQFFFLKRTNNKLHLYLKKRKNYIELNETKKKKRNIYTMDLSSYLLAFLALAITSTALDNNNKQKQGGRGRGSMWWYVIVNLIYNFFFLLLLEIIYQKFSEPKKKYFKFQP